MRTIHKVAALATFITSTLLGGLARGDDNSKSHNTEPESEFEFCAMPVRVTTYHKSEPGADYHTRREESSTGIKLREAKPTVIGTIATNQKVIPAGSLVLVKTKNGEIHPYLSVDVGGDVDDSEASRRLAKKEGRGQEWAKRPVVDIYSKRTIANDWTTVMVIKDELPASLTRSELTKRLKERMSVDYWPIKEACQILSRKV